MNRSKVTRRERGFSLVELMIVLCIVSVLLRVSLPAYSAMQRNARASQVVGDYNAVRAAAYAQYEATGSFPADGPSGTVPAGMAPYLPKNFSFTKPSYQLDWENWAVSDSVNSVTGSVVALTVVAPDDKLGRTLITMLGANSSHWSSGDAHTFVVQSTLESND